MEIIQGRDLGDEQVEGVDKTEAAKEVVQGELLPLLEEPKKVVFRAFPYVVDLNPNLRA